MKLASGAGDSGVVVEPLLGLAATGTDQDLRGRSAESIGCNGSGGESATPLPRAHQGTGQDLKLSSATENPFVRIECGGRKWEVTSGPTTLGST